MAGIFVSYRQADAKAWAISLRDELAEAFGADQVFLDKDTLHAGNWRDQIHAALDRCKVVLIVIGPHWLSTADDQNRPRIHLPDDVHHQEVALRRAKDRRDSLHRLFVDKGWHAPVGWRDELPRSGARLEGVGGQDGVPFERLCSHG